VRQKKPLVTKKTAVATKGSPLELRKLFSQKKIWIETTNGELFIILHLFYFLHYPNNAFL